LAGSILLDGGVISSCAVMPKIPLPVRDLDVFDLSGIEADVWLTTNLSYDAVINDGNFALTIKPLPTW
jgi:hypothetical protein